MLGTLAEVKLWWWFLDVRSTCRGKLWWWFLDIRSISKGKTLVVVPRCWEHLQR